MLRNIRNRSRVSHRAVTDGDRSAQAARRVGHARTERTAPSLNPRRPSVTQMIDLRRRGLLRGSGITVLSASAVALLAGCEKMASAQASNGASAANDVGILNTALALENEAISAYQ